MLDFGDSARIKWLLGLKPCIQVFYREGLVIHLKIAERSRELKVKNGSRSTCDTLPACIFPFSSDSELLCHLLLLKWTERWDLSQDFRRQYDRSLWKRIHDVIGLTIEQGELRKIVFRKLYLDSDCRLWFTLNFFLAWNRIHWTKSQSWRTHTWALELSKISENRSVIL